ncbi:MAG: PTS sugar transporter subunit IIC [Clostridia bacterium]|nr:PTS sugar transporter subunit IIC [Clostridia bacterium]
MKTIKRYLKRYFIDGFGAMALGLFSTLIIGTILAQIASIVTTYANPVLGTYILTIANMAKTVTGAGIGVAVAVKFGASPILTAAAGAAGMLGAFPALSLETLTIGKPGEPLGAFVAAVFAIEIGRLVSGKTKIDIVITPIVSLSAGAAAAFIVSAPISSFMTWLGTLVNVNVDSSPVLGGIIVSTLMGIFLTLPISSAAIGVSMGLSGLAAGAAVTGCCCQMVGFAVASYRDNGFGGLVAQGVGTSMIQIPNIMRRPQIWIAPTLASAVLGPISSAVLKMTNTSIGSGMGTSGLVGQFEAFSSMLPTFGTVKTTVMVLLMHVVLPAILTLAFDFVLCRIGWVKKGDMALNSLSK